MRTSTVAAGALFAGLLVGGLAPVAGAQAGSDAGADGGVDGRGRFVERVVATGLGNPYEILWGPDRHLWVTEKSGLRVTRVHPRTGARRTALELPDAVYRQQAGVLGLALHPDLLKGRGRNWVYLSYNYEVSTPDPVTGETLRARIVRYTYRPSTGKLTAPRTVITGLPGDTDHQSARLRVGPGGGKLFYTIGDQGANHQANYCNPNWAQRLPTWREVRRKDWTAYRGKTLRLNLDGSVPADNPRLRGVRSHVWTFGHRNAQGLTFGPRGRLYEAEQGPKTDDEVNLVVRGGNYGWPHVAGYRDGRAYTYENWSASSPTPCTELTFNPLDAPASVPEQEETEFTRRIVEPIHTFGTVDDDFDFTDPLCEPSGLLFICFPSVANSSLEHYRPAWGRGIPGWRRSLLMTTLKDGAVYRLTLTRDGTDVTDVQRLWKARDRYRDTAVSPSGRRIFVATDSSGLVRDAAGAPTTDLENPGAILEFRWRP
jgi:PQQ-dependent dehydrogenase (s-GDH family)